MGFKQYFRAKRITKRLKRLNDTYEWLKVTNNEGLLRNELWSWGLRRMSIDSSFSKTWVRVRMDDGYTLEETDFWLHDTLKKAIHSVMLRQAELWDILWKKPWPPEAENKEASND